MTSSLCPVYEDVLCLQAQKKQKCIFVSKNLFFKRDLSLLRFPAVITIYTTNTLISY